MIEDLKEMLQDALQLWLSITCESEFYLQIKILISSSFLEEKAL